jgi:hypothetical protein
MNGAWVSITANSHSPSRSMPCANVTYGNGVLMVALPISDQTSPARLAIARVTPTHGEHRGNAGHLATCVQT